MQQRMLARRRPCTLSPPHLDITRRAVAVDYLPCSRNQPEALAMIRNPLYQALLHGAPGMRLPGNAVLHVHAAHSFAGKVGQLSAGC